MDRYYPQLAMHTRVVAEALVWFGGTVQPVKAHLSENSKSNVITPGTRLRCAPQPRVRARPPYPQTTPASHTTMSPLDISSLSIQDHDAGPRDQPALPPDIAEAPEDDRYMQKLKNYAKSLPYSIESNSRMQSMLDFIVTRIAQCVEAKDYEPGLMQWDTMLS